MSFEFRPIPKKQIKFDLKGITKQLRDALEGEGIEHRKLLRKTTDSWTGDKPYFITETVVSKERLSVETAPHKTGKGGEIWWYLELGTSIRWALMSSNFRAKTRSGKLRSYRGRGRVLIAGRRAMTKRGIKPRPGIKARNWRAEVNRLRSRKFKSRIQKEFGIWAKTAITPKSLRG